MPRQDALYYVTAFSVSQQNGFGIIEQPLVVSDARGGGTEYSLLRGSGQQGLRLDWLHGLYEE